MSNDNDFKAAAVFLFIVIAAIGWAFIEALLWLLSFIDIGFSAAGMIATADTRSPAQKWFAQLSPTQQKKAEAIIYNDLRDYRLSLGLTGRDLVTKTVLPSERQVMVDSVEKQYQSSLQIHDEVV